MRATLPALAFALCGPALLGAQSATQGLPFLQYGPHAVGFRTALHLDGSRAPGPARDYAGKLTGADARLPMRVGIWYPTARQGAAMTVGDYRLLGGDRPADRAEALRATGAEMSRMAQFWLGRQLSPEEATAALAVPLRAAQDAPLDPERFPLVISGLSGEANAAPLAEYLASHGYVVVSTTGRPEAGALQVNAPQLALEMHTRQLEELTAFALDLPNADSTRLAVIGYNFDGMAAVIYQMRNMRAAAVVSIDGWEAKQNGFSTLTSSPWFDARRLRVPYLVFSQDAAPSPQLAPDTTILQQLRYSDRALYVVPGLTHAHLLGATAFPYVTDTARAGWAAEFGAIRELLDRSTARTTGAAGPPRISGVRPALAAVSSALPAVPHAGEFEALVMSGDLGEVQRVVRAALRSDPRARLFDPQTMNLFAFRFRQRNQPDVALGLLELTTEALPQSTQAQSQLGNAYEQAGRVEDARRARRRALELLHADPDIADADKPGWRSRLNAAVR